MVKEPNAQMASFFLAIEGPIGVGKTTLARLLQPRFKAELLLEAFEENPFLSNFYEDRARYAFQTQLFFLLSRYRQQQSVTSRQAQAPTIADYTFGKDSLFAHLNLEGDELDIYDQLYQVLADRVVTPDLVIYLRAETDALMVRIATRDRAYEREMDRDYIESVRQAYERYFSHYTRTPLLTIDTDDLDYVEDQSALAFVEGKVRKALGIGAYQQPLPAIDAAGPARIVESLIVEQPQAPDWQVMRDFLAANEALSQVGSSLVNGGADSDALETTLQEAASNLRHLAHRLGFDLE
jgi:deoxyguanosine kinase